MRVDRAIRVRVRVRASSGVRVKGRAARVSTWEAGGSHLVCMCVHVRPADANAARTLSAVVKASCIPSKQKKPFEAHTASQERAAASASSHACKGAR